MSPATRDLRPAAWMLASAIGLCAAAGAAAQPVSSPMPQGAPAEAPDGYLSLCQRSPDDCADGDGDRAGVAERARELQDQRWRERMTRWYAARSDRPAFLDQPAATPEPPARRAAQRLRLDRRLWAELSDVNARVNRRMARRDDADQYGVNDWWAGPAADGRAPRSGDCEDFALEKRRELIRDGVPAAALSIALARTAAGEPHAVLVVATDRGDYVLDSLIPDVRPWREVGYGWVERQSADDPLSWTRVGGRPRD